MIAITHKDWKSEFGLESREPPYFISNVDQIENPALNVPQSQTLRSAFEQLHVDGVLCLERNPTIYFRQMPKCDTNEILKLHRDFWNQGIAPILTIITPEEVHVYSGLIPPQEKPENGIERPECVEILMRVEEKLRSFILSVESGEYFHVHYRSFNPDKRVDRSLLHNLRATRQKLGEKAARLEPQTLDALLCRLIFTCYLFDRGIIDQNYLKDIKIHDAADLKGILAKKSRTIAIADLYTLFRRLKNDFNGDLFTSDLYAENRQIKSDHMTILDDCFNGKDVETGQQSLFSLYDFRFIPIETISAIYEHFLKVAGAKQKRDAGAYYTPRFLAEFVLDTALEGETTLLDKRFLDPACGSGIFLVGLFNRLAHEWKLKNKDASYLCRAQGLMKILTSNIFGVDKNRSACNITAFSLYLAFLDQLSPPDIRKLLVKQEHLPNLVFVPGEATQNLKNNGTIRCADFFTGDADNVGPVDVVVGNPPWGSEKEDNAQIVRWCMERNNPLPDKQMARAFIWKVASHLSEGGRVCFVLPHGILFHHSTTAVKFQQTFFRSHSVERIVNLADFRFFLFEESLAASIVMRYKKEKPSDGALKIDYWAPKTDWAVRQAEIISILPQDRNRVTLHDVLEDLRGIDAPLIWKKMFWATPRDRRLIERLLLYPRLRDHTSQIKEKKSDKPWLISQGFQPPGPGDLLKETKSIKLPTKLYIDAKNVSSFLIPEFCQQLPAETIQVRGRSGVNITAFKAPHVLVTRGFSSGHCAYTDFPLTFRSSVRGIHGPNEHRELLIFFSFYLRTALARYF
ncbi:MAG: N-6 DNA methylase [Chitinispirillaceae bacterium]|nr:N-6 DNA methylase [Chitinispirillaceae bacterium]